MQGETSWVPPTGVLATLTDNAHLRSRFGAEDLANLERRARSRVARRPPPSLVRALQRPDVAVIAELKRRSPSKGVLDDSLDAAVVVRAFAEGGAAAASILTEPTAFGGAIADLETASGEVAIPLLRKDFIVSGAQVFEAAASGAAAVLLIARALGPDGIRPLVEVAHGVGLECLVEVRSEAELAWGLEAGADVIGVNTRNLETLVIDPAVAERLLPLVPPELPAVFESGIRERSDVERAAAIGADAVLVGSSLSAAGSTAAAVRRLAGVSRIGRRGV